MESRKEGEDDDSTKTDWGMLFMLLKNRGFNHNEILGLTYPQFNVYMSNIAKIETYQVVIPYLGGGDNKDDAVEMNSEQDLMSIVASMNSDFG